MVVTSLRQPAPPGHMVTSLLRQVSALANNEVTVNAGASTSAAAAAAEPAVSVTLASPVLLCLGHNQGSSKDVSSGLTFSWSTGLACWPRWS